MGKLKEAALTARKDATLKEGPHLPDKYTYALKAYTAERRKDGWWVTKTPVAIAGERPSWAGPYPTIEEGCLAIGRYLATEIANRHSVMIAGHKLKPSDPLYGLKATTRLAKTGKSLT